MTTDALLASLLIGWDDFQSMAGWAGLVSVVVVAAMIERMRTVFATQEDLDEEMRARQIADEHRDSEMRRQAELVQQYIGKIDLLRDRMEKQDRAREREVASLRQEVRTGFAKVEAKLDRNGGGP